MRRKLDAKNRLCFFVGNTDNQKGDRYWDPMSGKINISRDVSPIRHHYVPQPDWRKGIDVCHPNDILPETPAPASERHTIHPAIMVPLSVRESDDVTVQPENVDDNSQSGQQQLTNLKIICHTINNPAQNFHIVAYFFEHPLVFKNVRL